MEIRDEPLSALGEHGGVPIAFRVEQEMRVTEEVGASPRRWILEERPVVRPYLKDYDALPGNTPADWPFEFDTAAWGLLSAHDDGHRLGGAVIALRTAGLQVLEGRDDLAVLWDLRVHPAHRGRGVGTALFAASERWAATRGGDILRIETQNINVDACRFYARRGCTLRSVNRFAYPHLPDEIQLIWEKDLAGVASR